MTEPENYETAVGRLEQIIARLDSGEAELRETLALCTEAKTLIEYCKTELDAVSGELTELKLDELVAELERPAGAEAAATVPGGNRHAYRTAVASRDEHRHRRPCRPAASRLAPAPAPARWSWRSTRGSRRATSRSSRRAARSRARG